MKNFLLSLSILIQQKKWFRSLALGTLTFLLIISIHSMGLLQTLEFTTLNQAYTHRKNVEVNPDIAFWNLDDTDIETLRWPWGWNHMAEIVNIMNRYGIKLGLIQEDIFSTAGNPTLSEKQKDERSEKLGDAFYETPEALKKVIKEISSSPHESLAKALDEYPHIVLSQSFLIPDDQRPFTVQEKTKRQQASFLPQKKKSIAGILQKGFPVPENMPGLLAAINMNPLGPHLQEHLSDVSFMRITPDEDGTIRQIPTVVQYDGILFFSQPIVAAVRHFGVPLSQLKLSPGQLTFSGVVDDKTGKDLVVPIDEQGRMYVNWTQEKQLEAFTQIPFSVVRSLATWDMMKSIIVKYTFDPDDIENTLVSTLLKMMADIDTKLQTFGWENKDNITILRSELMCGWIMQSMIEAGHGLPNIMPIFTSLDEKLLELDLDLMYSSIYLNTLLTVEEDLESSPAIDSFLSDDYGLHPYRIFYDYLNYAFEEAGDIIATLGEFGILVEDEDYDGDHTRILFTNFHLPEDQWLTDMVIKTNLKQEEIKSRFLTLYKFMQSRLDRLKSGYTNTWFHLQKKQIDLVKPLYFPRPFRDSNSNPTELLSFKDKTVFVGLTATGLNALNPTPYAGRYSMASLTPAAFNTITTGKFISRMDWVGPILVFGYAVFVLFLVFYGNTIVAFILTFGLAIGHYYLGTLMLETHGKIVPIVMPVLSVFSSYLSANVYLYIEAQKERQKVRGMFAAMVSPEVLKIMEDEPDKFNLRGEKVEASMFSSDVSGFTSISEGVTAQELALILNLYLTPMSNLVMTFGGYVEKYEGDAIKADFGMPLPDPDHAWKACFSALLQQEELTVVQRMLQLKYGVMITARMGVNTGVVNAGNMGSINKMQYCALGEEVAMAEELEPSNKMWETWIAISPETLRLSGDRLETRLLDVVEYDHCTIPVYELIGWKEDVFLEYWKGKPIPKLVIEGWERIIPEKILAYIDYYHQNTYPGNTFYEHMISSFEGLEKACLDFMMLNDRIEVAGLERRYRELLTTVDGYGVTLGLDDLDPVDRKEMDDLAKARDKAEEPWLKILNAYLVELKMRTHISHRLLDKISQDDINELLTAIDTLEKNCNCYIKRNRFPAKDDQYGNTLKDHLVSILPEPTQGLSPEQLETMKTELEKQKQAIKQGMNTFIAKTKSLAEDYHRMMAKHCLFEEKKRKVCDIFAQGRALYLGKKWDEAISLFQQGLALDPDDGPCMKFIERCENFKKNPPAEDWVGTWEANW